MSDPSDQELVNSMASGDSGAFSELYRKHQAAVFRFALQMSGSAALAEDVVQETFLVLMRSSGAYNPARGTLPSFLYGVARHQVLRRVERRWVASEPDADEPVAADHPESDAARGQAIAAVRAAVLALPLHYREAVVLCDLEETGYEEAAAVLGCSVGTVRSRLHRGRRLLARRLGAFDGTRTRDGIRPAGCSI